MLEYIRYYLTDEQSKQESLFAKLSLDKQNAITRAKLKLLREGEEVDEGPVSDKRQKTRDKNIRKAREKYKDDLEAAEKAAKERDDILANKIPSLVEAINKGMGKTAVTADTSIGELSAILTAFQGQDIEGLDAARDEFIKKFKTPTDWSTPLKYNDKEVIMTLKDNTIYQLPQQDDQALGPDLGEAWPAGTWTRRLVKRPTGKRKGTFDNYLRFTPSSNVEFTKRDGPGIITIGPKPQKFNYIHFRSIPNFKKGTPDYPDKTNKIDVPFLPKWLTWGGHTQKGDGSANKGKTMEREKKATEASFDKLIRLKTRAAATTEYSKNNILQDAAVRIANIVVNYEKRVKRERERKEAAQKKKEEREAARAERRAEREAARAERVRVVKQKRADAKHQRRQFNKDSNARRRKAYYTFPGDLGEQRPFAWTKLVKTKIRTKTKDGDETISEKISNVPIPDWQLVRLEKYSKMEVFGRTYTILKRGSDTSIANETEREQEQFIDVEVEDVKVRYKIEGTSSKDGFRWEYAKRCEREDEAEYEGRYKMTEKWKKDRDDGLFRRKKSDLSDAEREQRANWNEWLDQEELDLTQSGKFEIQQRAIKTSKIVQNGRIEGTKPVMFLRAYFDEDLVAKKSEEKEKREKEKAQARKLREKEKEERKRKRKEASEQRKKEKEERKRKRRDKAAFTEWYRDEGKEFITKEKKVEFGDVSGSGFDDKIIQSAGGYLTKKDDYGYPIQYKFKDDYLKQEAREQYWDNSDYDFKRRYSG